ncbi:MAG: hypothetical protein K0U72_14765 [Gammaproteobacteria bacterium]|nr:hypothetical protein [Gammaproteobacteria bacterium]
MNNKMWLPEGVYERVPQLWFLMGVLFITFGLYIGFAYNLIYMYLALGGICIGRSIWCFQTRRDHRGEAESSQAKDSQDGQPTS